VNASNTAQNNPTENRRWCDFDDAGIGATGNPDNVGKSRSNLPQGDRRKIIRRFRRLRRLILKRLVGFPF